MPDATEAEIADATRRWFGFLRTIDHIVFRVNQERKDSSIPNTGDTVDGIFPSV